MEPTPHGTILPMTAHHLGMGQNVESAQLRFRAVRTKLPYHHHPDIAGHSFKTMNDQLERLFVSGPFDYGMAVGAANLIAVFYYHYDQQTPHQIPPARYVAFTRTLIDDLKNPRSDLWEVINWTYMRAYGIPIGKDHKAAIAQEAVSKLAHDIHDRLKPHASTLDAAALNDLAFEAEPLRKSILGAIDHWTAEEELHPLHDVLHADMKLDPALEAKGDAALQHHILNREGIGHLEMRLQNLLAEDRRLHGSGRGHRLDAKLIKDAENIIIDFLFYSQPGIRPVDIDPHAFSNKALEVYLDARFVTHRHFENNLRDLCRDPEQLEAERKRGGFQAEKIPESYGVENKYSVFKAFAVAFHRVYGYPAPYGAMVELKQALVGSSLPETREHARWQKRPLPRIDHEVFVARCIDPAIAADREGRDWFVAGRAAIDDGRGFLLQQMRQAWSDREGDPALVAELAKITVEHYRLTSPNFWHHARGLNTTGRSQSRFIDPFTEESRSLTSAAARLAEEKAWKPFVSAYAEANDGRTPPEGLLRDYHAGVIHELERQARDRLGLDGLDVSRRQRDVPRNEREEEEVEHHMKESFGQALVALRQVDPASFANRPSRWIGGRMKEPTGLPNSPSR